MERTIYTRFKYVKNCPMDRINKKIWPMYFMTECIREQLKTDFSGGPYQQK